MPLGHPGHQGSRTPGSSWYHIVYSCPSFFLTHPSRRYGFLILKFIVTFKRAGKANPWRRLSLLNKHYNNYWWPNAVALALEGIHNPVEVLNQTARYKHYSKTYYLSPPHPHHLPACDKVVDHTPWEYWYFLRFCVGGWLFVTVAHIRRYEMFFVTIFPVA